MFHIQSLSSVPPPQNRERAPSIETNKGLLVDAPWEGIPCKIRGISMTIETCYGECVYTFYQDKVGKIHFQLSVSLRRGSFFVDDPRNGTNATLCCCFVMRESFWMDPITDHESNGTCCRNGLSDRIAMFLTFHVAMEFSVSSCLCQSFLSLKSGPDQPMLANVIFQRCHCGIFPALLPHLK